MADCRPPAFADEGSVNPLGGTHLLVCRLLSAGFGLAGKELFKTAMIIALKGKFLPQRR